MKVRFDYDKYDVAFGTLKPGQTFYCSGGHFMKINTIHEKNCVGLGGGDLCYFNSQTLVMLTEGEFIVKRA